MSERDNPCWVSQCPAKINWKVESFPMGTRGYACSEHLSVPVAYLSSGARPVLVGPV